VKKECKIGGPVRLGLEQSGTVDWCDPFLPSPWNGNKILSRQNGKCYWGDRVVNQCFGLGAEQMNSDGSSKNAAECEKACCESPECEIWQQQDGRGCYYNKNDGINVCTCSYVYHLYTYLILRLHYAYFVYYHCSCLLLLFVIVIVFCTCDTCQCLADPVPYEGARKCIHEYCGTPEEEEAILSRYRAMKQS
jgi:hypothetical protein